MLNIVLINYNSSEDTINCVNSIIASNKVIDCKVLVIDNDSSAEEKQKLADYEKSYVAANTYVKEFKVYFHNQNAGFAAGNNYWLKLIPENEYAWILNNDTLVNETLFNKIAENLPEDKQVVYFDCHDFENNFHDSGLHYISLITGRYHVQAKSKNDFGYICGASFVIKKTTEMPYWNEEYFLYFEDVDYSVALKEKGYTFIHLDDCYFNHKISASSNKIKKSNYYKLRSQIIFMKKYGKNLALFRLSKLFILLCKLDFAGIKTFNSLYKAGSK